MTYTEDQLTQQTLADYLVEELGWESVYAHNTEKLGDGVDGTLGRRSQSEVVLTRYLKSALAKLNPNLPDEAYQSAVRQITETIGFQSIVQVNRQKYALIRDGVLVSYQHQGEIKKQRLRVLDFDNPENNHFLCVRELWVQGIAHRRRPDLIGFVNGLPLLFVECKRPDKNLRRAYDDNIADYRDTIPQAFYFNAFVMLANGFEAKMGSITAHYEHFSDWKRLAEREPGVVNMETLVKGTCSKANFIDIVENFILFDDSSGQTVKIVARNHQYLGVNAAVNAVRERQARDRKLGVFWHTQGAGKSYAMALFAQKVRRKLGGDFTFLVLTDRQDLDKQIYQTFAGVGLADNDKDTCRAESGAALKNLLAQHKAFVFALVQKFNQQIATGGAYSTRSNIIVITDEAHRTQYGALASNMRAALPNANFIGFTGTPLFSSDEVTRRVFGDYVSTYDFQRAVDDKATLPLYYDARGEKLDVTTEGLNDKLAATIAEAEIADADVTAKLEDELKREYHALTAEKRLNDIARDFVKHYVTHWQSGKAMFVAIDKITAVRMHDLIAQYWQASIDKLEQELELSKPLLQMAAEPDVPYQTSEDSQLSAKIDWMRETEFAVVVSDEQGEVERFKKWGLDIFPHRQRMKDGFVLEDGSRLDVDTAFKRDDHPFRIVIVCAMWLTGFDVPSLSTLYLDKPLQAHTLMQAIARANRVKEGKNNGLIVDYCGILKNLRKALATFATGQGGDDRGGSDPLHPEQELLEQLAEAIAIVRDQLSASGFALDDLAKASGFAKNKALMDAKEVINTSDETRKRFEIAARAVFRKYKACLTIDGITDYQSDYASINFIYKTLAKDKLQADTSAIIQKLNAIVSEAIQTRANATTNDRIFDISKINFELLREEFSKSQQPKTELQSMKQVLEQRLHKMLMANPLRTDFQQRYDEIVANYNQEKDKNTIEATFEELMTLAGKMTEEQHRYIKEELESEQQLAVFDMLRKPNLSKADIKKIKKVSVALLEQLHTCLAKEHDTFAKASTSDGFKQTIYDFLYNDQTGLPSAYSENDIEDLTVTMYDFFRNQIIAA